VATGRGWLGRWLAKGIPASLEIASLGGVPIRPEASVLDVGCGRGHLLSVLHRAGFRQLLGVDPYLPEDVEVLHGLRVLKRPLHAVEAQFDCIMLHHVFEHVEEGLEMLRACRERLAKGGRIVLRMPMVECAAWQRYGECWVGLDAPRHLVLHTYASLQMLVGAARLRVVRLWHDSGALQFTASELYRKGLPLFDAERRPARMEQHFTRRQLKEFDREAVELNRAGRGDQIAALLAPAAG